MKTQNISLAEYLALRSQWEHIVSYRKSFKVPSYDGTICNLQWFIEHGSVGNRFRKRYAEAHAIASKLVELSNDGKIT